MSPSSTRPRATLPTPKGHAGLTSIPAQREAAKSGQPLIELLPVEEDPNKMPLPFATLLEADPLSELLDQLPLCPSN